MFSRALNSSLSGSGPAPGCPSNLPCLATDDFCYKYDCAVARICSTAACKCSGDAACAGSLSGTTSTPYCLSGTCSSLSPGVIAGITIAVLVVVVAVVICIVRRRQNASNNSGPQVQVYTTLPPGFQAQYQQPPQQTYQQPYQAQSYQQPQQYQQQPYAPQQQQPYVPQQQPHTTAPPSNWQ